MKEIQILNNGDTLNAIRTKINENFALTKEGIEEGVADPLAKFGVNEGNETDGVADLLNIEEGTLSFKVGGEYPNLVMTSGDGVTTEIESVNDLHLQNLADGEYKILVNGEASQVSSSEFYSQLTEPQNINNGDVWFNGESTKQYLTDAPSVTPITPKTTINYKCMGNIGDLYIAAGGGQYFYISRDAGTTWESRVLPANVSGFLSCVVKDGYFYFATSTSSIMRTAEGEDPQVHHKFAETFYPQKLRLINDLFFLTATGPTLSTSADAKTWTTVTIGTQPIIDVLFIDSLYYAISRDGIIYTSSDLSAWTQLNKIEQSTGIQCVKVYKNNIILGGISGTLFIYSLENNTFTIKNIGSSEVILDMQVRPNGAMIFVGSNNMCKITYDFITYQNLYTSGGYLEHIYKDFIMGQAGSFLRINQTVQWFDYPWVPVGEVTISGGQVTYVFTYPYNSNGLHEASSSTFGLLRTAAPVDETNCNCTDAVLTPANLYTLNNYRTVNTEYQADEKVGCPYHHNLQLKCIVAGTTSNEALDTKGTLEPGTTITDGTVTWEVEELGTGGGSYLGQTIFSLDPLYEDGLHLLDGSLLQADGIYANFVSNYISNLYANYPNRFCTEEEWQTSVTTYGVCGKYVYTEGVSARLPKVTGIVEGTIDVNALGEITEAGLPNITGSAMARGPEAKNSSSSGALSITETTDDYGNGHSTGGKTAQLDLDASLSNPIYGNSDTVQPQAIKGYYYIVVATGTKTSADVEIDNIVTDLNSKVGKESLIPINGYLVESYQNGTMGLAHWSNGLLIQWGKTGSAGANTNTTVTLLKSYTSKDSYIAVASHNGLGSAYGDSTGINSQSAEKFVIHTQSGGATWHTIGFAEVQ